MAHRDGLHAVSDASESWRVQRDLETARVSKDCWLSKHNIDSRFIANAELRSLRLPARRNWMV